MKPSLLAVLGLLMPVCAHAANNNIKMVTYFPIPYVSYNELGVTKTCDLGLMDGCVLDSGSSLLVHKTASDGALRLKEGKLSLNGPLVSGDAFHAGTTDITGSSLKFKHSVDVKSMTQSVQSLEVTNRAYLGELNLFGESFPKCENNNSREMTWKRLTINGKEGVFLVCGAGEKPQPTCTDRTYKLANKSICCPSASYSDTDCWIYKETSCVFEGDVGMGSFYGASKSFELKDSVGSCRDKYNVVLNGSYSQTVGPEGRTCPEGAAPGTSCKGIVEDGNYCAYIEDLGSLGSAVDCWQNGSMCTCSYNQAPALWCKCENGGYVANNW